MKRWRTWCLWGLLLGLLSLFVAGCSSTEPENVSTRPWNAPKNWQFGVPGMPDYYR